MDIKIFVCCHQPVEVPQHPLLVPLQVGAALADTHFPGFLHDDTGDNISFKNRSYCELTGQYWAWKNVDADYYGFFHYRRYLYPNKATKRAYRIEENTSSKVLNKLRFSSLEFLIPQYDLILPKSENMYVSVQKHYASAPFHHGEDLELVKEILKDRHPDCEEAINAYLIGSCCYFGNIFIMKRELFQNYCNWLFSILEAFDYQADVSAYSVQERRVDGYLAERLLGIFCMYHRESRILELPRVHFVPQRKDRVAKNLQLTLLPPGTRRRAFIKSLFLGTVD